MNLLKKLAGETAIYGISNMLSRMVNFLLVPMYTRILKETGDYAIVTEMYAYVGLLMVLATYRMETGFFRFGSDKGQKQEAFTTAMMPLLATTPLLVLLGIILAPGIASGLGIPDRPYYIVWFAIIMGMDALSRVPLAKLRLDGRPRMFVWVQMTNIGVNVGLNLFFLLLCPWLLGQGHTWVSKIYDPQHLVDYIFISNLAASSVMLLMLLPTFRSITWRFNRPLFRRMMRYVLPLIPVGLAAIINEVMDKPMLTWLLPGTLAENRAQMGIYAANYKLATLMTIITQGFNYAAEPFFFNHKSRKDTAQLYGKVGQSFAIIGSVAFLGIMLFLDVVLQFLGPKYVEPEGMAIIPIVLLANLFLGLYYNFAIWYKLADKTHIGMYIAGVGVAITLSMNIGLIPLWGMLASAWATFCCYAVMAALAYVLGQRYYPIHYPILRMAAYILVALACYGGAEWLLPSLGMSEYGQYACKTLVFIAYLAYIYAMEKNRLFREFFAPVA